MSRLPPIPDPLHCVLFDAGDTLLAPEKRLARADIVIDNSGSLEKLGRRVDEVWEELQARLAS
jgi:hypothetical protein